MQIAFLHIIKMFPKHGLFSQNQAFIRSCTKMHLIALFLVINVSNNLYGAVIRSCRNNKEEDYEDFVAKLLTRCFNILRYFLYKLSCIERQVLRTFPSRNGKKKMSPAELCLYIFPYLLWFQFLYAGFTFLYLFYT
jgi:hypothetical protein